MTPPAAPSPPPLCTADDATFWAWHRWPEFSRWVDPADTLVIVPLAGMADWGLGHGLDAEETMLTHLLRTTLQQHPPAPGKLLVTPPLRFVFGPADSCAFSIDPPTFHRLLDEVVESIALSGFRRIVLINSSPWNEEITAAAARDLRISRGLQMFRISLSGLGLDFRPGAGGDHRPLQTLITAFSGRSAADPDALNWDEAAAAAPAILAPIIKRLAGLIAEIKAWPPLPDHGRIPPAIAP
ncbi:creatininase family protein [Synoicihabitans lomoniglobus]|uniref:Creatininase family protein n=1 Tax=Synoicihabitans lomoniglobus TaxID=2909285 RepID=A0AAF0CRB9_9BACT|nr:creatininase family protein [Opitutaceae bacterium LMO-M01]WED66633.1 creatininase family protein [Opitutaceae bacterium LMO-M01]